jgi:L-iditol 2-dehydrogenase
LWQINLKFINRYRDTWPAGISALSGGILNLDMLVTHTFPLEEATAAMELCSDPSKGSIKVQVIDERNIEL